MNGIAVIALPAGITYLLSLLFQFGKQGLASVPGFRQNDADHAQHFQLLFFALCLLVIGAVSFASMAHPTTIDGWSTWLAGVVATAIGMAFGGNFAYSKISNGASGASDPTSDPTVTQNGLPLTTGQ